jgi:arylsulfatase A-like enzyme
MNFKKRPNFVFILMDDMGWNQTGWRSNFYETPNLDCLAKEGMHFSEAYGAAPICSASRASIMTGKSPARLHLTRYIPGDSYPWAKLKRPNEVNRLPLEEVTIAKMLKQKEYKSAMIGKWHLNEDKNYRLGRGGDPKSHGFDYVHTAVKPTYDTSPGEDAHHTISLTDSALHFMRANKNKPFFLYLAFNAIHRPVMEHPNLIYKYQQKRGADLAINNPIMAAMIQRLDMQIGRLMDELKKLKLDDQTVVIFTSDHGGFAQLQSQLPLRGGKSMLYEGGIRVPLIIRWPGIIKSGSQSSVPVVGTDLFPTITDIAKIGNLPLKLDGISLFPLLKQTGELKRSKIHWHYPNYHRWAYMPSGAIRQRGWKLIVWYERSFLGKPHPVSLYNIKEDMGETNDLADKMPQKANQLWDNFKKWKQAVGAQEMSENPQFDSAKALYWSQDVDSNKQSALGQYY